MFFKKNNNLLLIFTLIALIVYIIIRAVLLDITNDEAYSFYIVKRFWYVEALCTANTHWLNSLAIKCSLLLNLEKIWQIRWFSILSAIGFLYIIFLWIRSANETPLKIFLCVLLLLNPYILDYFVMARGYAPGLMLQASALFFFFLSQTKPNKFYTFIALLCAGLSALANFSFTYFFIAFCGIYFLKFYFKKENTFYKSKLFYRDLFFTLLIFAIITRALVFITKCSNDIVYAGTNNIHEYFKVFCDGLIYRKFVANTQTLTCISYFIGIIIFISGINGIVNYKKHNQVIYFYCSSILIIMLSASFIGNLCFKIMLPYYRSAIFLFPTSAICLTYFINSILKKEAIKKIAMYSLSALLVLNFALSINFKSVFDFYYQANLKESFDFLESIKAKNVGICPELFGGYRNYYQMTDNYKYTFNGEEINTNFPKGTDTKINKLKGFDYILLFPPYNVSYYKNNIIKLKAEKIFKETGTIILKVESTNCLINKSSN